MVGPYAVAHYRLARALKSIGAEPEKERLNIYLADTLAPVGDEKEVDNPLGFMGKPIVEERMKADEVKREKPILAIFGNPPYRRLRGGETYGLVGAWVADHLWPRYIEPVSKAGWAIELNTFPDLYKAFLAWSQWKLFWREDAPKRGVLCLITNRTYLTGHPDAGIRLWLRREFDQIDILDLRGDLRGAKPAGVQFDENVFDVEVGVAIMVGWATGAKKKDTLAQIRYSDIWAHGAFSREQKSSLLRSATLDPSCLTFVTIDRAPLDDFRPGPFEGRGWIALPHCFSLGKSGTKTQRDNLVVGFKREQLIAQISQYKAADVDGRYRLFFPGNDKPSEKLKKAEAMAYSQALDPANIVEYSYRIFDNRFVYMSRGYVQEPCWLLQTIIGAENGTIYTLPSGVGVGPAIVVHKFRPDHHAFRGSYGGYAFPLFDRRPGGHGYNLDLRLVESLSKYYQSEVGPEDVFDVIVALLSAPSYTRRFASDLEDAFPHVPLPADRDIFEQAAEVGARIRRLQTSDSQPEQHFWTARLEGSPKDRTLAVSKIGSAFLDQGNGLGTIRLNGTLRLERVPVRVWEFAVSGYRVVYRWLDARKGLSLDEVIDEESGETLQRQVLDLIARVAAYVDACEAAEPVLEAALASPLTKSDLKYTQSALL